MKRLFETEKKKKKFLLLMLSRLCESWVVFFFFSLKLCQQDSGTIREVISVGMVFPFTLTKKF